MDNISIDFESAQRKASELEEIAAELNRLVKGEYQQILQELSINWKGESADAYHQKAELLQEQFMRTVYDINTVANNIRNTAQKIYNAEMYAKQLAEKRN